MVFIPRKYRTYKAVLYLMAAEFPFVLVILILTGIASHNTYTTKLWQDGANNGFNSAPNQIVYALTNGRSYKVPMVWSAFLTNYNLVIGVLSTFLLLTKAPMHVLRVFHPPLSAIVHGSLTALYIVSARFQAGSDMTDPRHPQPGPPWYITKNCNVAYYKSNIGYCQQAKSLFAVTVIACVIYFTQFVLAVISCFATKEEREARRQRKEEKRAEKEAEEQALREYDEILKSPAAYGLPMTPAAAYTGYYAPPFSPISPMAPRTPAFNRVSDGSSSDLPLRNHFSTPNPQRPVVSTPDQTQTKTQTQPMPQPQPYFPPPPTKPTN
ncbi:hypothetical protein VTN96DRAFT_9585 [Rasamsonia emersonii]|uniref:MARVEL domain-containing protein n=1 Tax=Rasamsonia emersonii (strain ATCC 16479 / CBS 393.64 / IMI 116815) TaxID=1408163 RepID=A0A0F4YR78_RASE3|nr:hypothetical protein T310_5242 [Rasamsonia emersonii CBS 393.64]KKA20744.1 hypothetical protein T310_5242 [Rasamsonia emersonii CBS 393.64]